MGKPNPCQQYLTTYAESEAAIARRFSFRQSYQYALVIPAYNEQPHFLSALQTLCYHNNVLLILIVNQPSTESDPNTNHELWQFLRNQMQPIATQQHLHLLNWGGVNVIAVDRFTGPLTIPPSQGVGLARKIGCDIAATLIDTKVVNNHWIYTTDADTCLPTDYFQRLNGEAGSAAVYPFIHQGKTADAIAAATLVYQQSLHYYVKGLQWAGSPYAFHTIGSCIAVNAADYCRARGFPKRAGGEDFYLLNKLAKLGKVNTLTGVPITINPRRSQRAPFGTGPAVEKLLALDKLEDFSTYNPQVFVELKELLFQLSNAWHYRNDEDSWWSSLTLPSRQACQSLGVNILFNHLRKQVKAPDAAVRHIHHWFDGFRTLKFIHSLQRHHYPPVPIGVALQQSTLLFNLVEEESL